MIRKLFFITTTTILILSIFAGIVSAWESQPVASHTMTTAVKANLENVRTYAAGARSGLSYAVDGGELYAGRPGEWRHVATPAGVIVGAVALDSARPGVVYIGAANELAIYRRDGADAWLRVPLTDRYVGGVTSLAIDKANRLVYVGTDTAGIFRLRDVGSSMIAGGHTPLPEAVVEMAADSTGAGLLFARTPRTLYQGESAGMRWHAVENLASTPTALEIVNGYPATVYVGTADRGLLTSQDGMTWNLANDGLNFQPGTRLSVDAIAADPAQLDVLYVATSYLFGSTSVHQTPVAVYQSTDGGAMWQPLAKLNGAPAAELLPIAGQTGALYAVTLASRQPIAMGAAPVIVESAAPAAAATIAANGSALTGTTLTAWIIAVLAALALAYALRTDLLSRSQPATPALTLQRQSVSRR